MRTRSAVVAAHVGIIAALTGVAAGAHHSWTSEFSEDKPIVLRGTLTKVELVNPHGWLWLDVKNPDGTVTTWGIEGGAPNGLIRNGITKNTLKVGEELIVHGYRARDDANLAAGVSYTRAADGKEFFLAYEGPEAAAKAHGEFK
jgi:hypothetical protein